MIWRISYAQSAYLDLQNIYDYIADTLLEPKTAEHQTARIMDAIDSLDNMPMRHALWDDEPWRSKGLRFMPVDNYLVFYFPDPTQNIVTIIRVMYERRNITMQLSM